MGKKKTTKVWKCRNCPRSVHTSVDRVLEPKCPNPNCGGSMEFKSYR